ncbi:RbsD/FucU family protein [Neotabrizicola sp. sgz301269]|uniref:RbsD/FucU family protein n=1 Tax=Neotabrizicola sp. sgz301269 TaxID=3276282 RepID=UPI003770594D
MLIGLSPLLGPDLLYALRAMGHGDEIALVDGNYPAQSHAQRLVRADGHGVLALLEAILPVLPLDADVPAPILRASLLNDPAQRGAIHEGIEALAARLAPGVAVAALSGEALYPRIRAAHTIVATGEAQLYGNVILRKGVVRPGAQDARF